MILFICPSCEERFVLSVDQVRSTVYLSCEKCDRIVPYELIESLKTVFKYYPQGKELGPSNPLNWTINISQDDIVE